MLGNSMLAAGVLCVILTNASCHDSLDERSDVLILHRALPLSEATAIRAEVHRLILQVALHKHTTTTTTTTTTTNEAHAKIVSDG